METIEVTPVIIYKKPFELKLLQRKQVFKDEFIEHYEKKDCGGYLHKFPFRFLLDCRQPNTTIEEIFLVFEKLKKTKTA